MKTRSLPFLVIAIASLLFSGAQETIAQQTYITPWFQFDMARGWIKVDQGERPPSFPAIYSPSYGALQADVTIRFGTVNAGDSLSTFATQKRQTFRNSLSNYKVLADRIFTITNGYSCHEYYVEAQGSRFRWFDILVPDGDDKYLASFWGYSPPQDTSKTTDSQILQMVNSARPVIDAPVITSHPTSTSVLDGDTVVLNVDYSSNALYNDIEWYHNGIPLGVDSKTLEIPNFRESYAGQYWAIVSSFAGESRSRTANITWMPRLAAPEIVVNPRSQSIIDGSSAELSVTISSTSAYTLRWLKDGREILRSSLNANQSLSKYNFGGFSAEDSGQYWVTASNSAGTSTSSKATLTWVAQTFPPEIVKHPQPVTVAAGQSFELEVEVSGSEPMSLEWQLNGNALAGQNRSSLMISSATSANSGTYRVVAKNDKGIAYSNGAVVTVLVNTPPTGINLIVNEANVDLLKGSSFATIQVSDPDAGDSHVITIEGESANYFEVSGNSLILTQSLEQMRGGIAKFLIKAIDSFGAGYDYAFQVPIPESTNGNENGGQGNQGNNSGNEQVVAPSNPDSGSLSSGFAAIGPANTGEVVAITSAGKMAGHDSQQGSNIQSSVYTISNSIFVEDSIASLVDGEVIGISEDGNTLYGFGSGRNASGWVYDGKSVKEIPELLRRVTIPSGVSEDGTIVVGNNDLGRAFRWNAGSRTVSQLISMRAGRFVSREDSANAISSDGNVIVGHSERLSLANRAGLRAVRWTKQGLQVNEIGTLGAMSSATDVSANGDIIVGFSDSNKGREAFVWSDQTKMQGLGDLEGGEYYSEATGVSSDGKIVVGIGSGADGSSGFIWSQSEGIRDIALVLGKYGWSFDNGIADISSDGKFICGVGTNPRGEKQGWMANDPSAQWKAKSTISISDDSVRSFAAGNIQLDIFKEWQAAHVFVGPEVSTTYKLQALNPVTSQWETVGSTDNHRETSKGYRSIYYRGGADEGIAHIFRVIE
jgi:probable HAF family extracellular repeat protein